MYMQESVRNFDVPSCRYTETATPFSGLSALVEHGMAPLHAVQAGLPITPLLAALWVTLAWASLSVMMHDHPSRIYWYALWVITRWVHQLTPPFREVSDVVWMVDGISWMSSVCLMVLLLLPIRVTMTRGWGIRCRCSTWNPQGRARLNAVVVVIALATTHTP